MKAEIVSEALVSKSCSWRPDLCELKRSEKGETYIPEVLNQCHFQYYTHKHIFIFVYAEMHTYCYHQASYYTKLGFKSLVFVSKYI